MGVKVAVLKRQPDPAAQKMPSPQFALFPGRCTHFLVVGLQNAEATHELVSEHVPPTAMYLLHVLTEVPTWRLRSPRCSRGSV
jgi:hypothetical protein